MNGTVTVDLERCARCGGDHCDVSFEPLVRPMVDRNENPRSYWTHWAPCPKNGQPVLLRVTV